MSESAASATTTELARRLRAAFGEVPEPVLNVARLHLLDAIGVGLAAARFGPVAGVAGLTSSGGSGPSSVFGSQQRTTPAVAALANGTLIHSLEFDDTHGASVMHGSSVVAAAALAVAEQTGTSTRELVAAFAVGWELMIRIGLAAPGSFQARGFQVTSAGGAFAAATVSGLLHHDSDAVIGNAIGIAGSQAGGTFAFLAGGDTVKAAQPGWAAHSGLLAADLARAGVTGPDGVFDGRYGFFNLYAGDADAGARFASLAADLGERWALPEASFKLLPCCHYIHPFVEALDELLADGTLVDDVESVHCFVPEEAVPVIAEDWLARQRPAKAHDARWSLPYVLALRLLRGDVPVSAFAGECDTQVSELAERFTYEPWGNSGFPARFPARLRLRTTSGAERDVVVEDVRGSAGRPVDDGVVIAKAGSNLGQAGMESVAVDRLVAEVLDPGGDFTVIAALLRL